MLKLREALLVPRAAEYARLFSLEHPNQVVSSTPFQQKEFGESGSYDKAFQALGVTTDTTRHLNALVVSLALFDD